MTEVYTELLQENSELETKILRLEQENKELKEMLSKEPKAMQAFQIAYSGLKRDNEVLWGVVKDYRSALEEINILVKNYCNACDEFKAKTYKNKNDCLYCNYGFIKRKINEVLNEN